MHDTAAAGIATFDSLLSKLPLLKGYLAEPSEDIGGWFSSLFGTACGAIFVLGFPIAFLYGLKGRVRATLAGSRDAHPMPAGKHG